MQTATESSKILTYYSEQSVNIASDYATVINMKYLGDVNGDQSSIGNILLNSIHLKN
ncbi:hypothetical protein SAMN02910353_00382 [Ruminococcus sp. YRD2003]|nr:hypothetical protein SAMN02910353_00382 [Ruminococcus flavefaciens]